MLLGSIIFLPEAATTSASLRLNLIIYINTNQTPFFTEQLPTVTAYQCAVYCCHSNICPTMCSQWFYFFNKYILTISLLYHSYFMYCIVNLTVIFCLQYVLYMSRIVSVHVMSLNVMNEVHMSSLDVSSPHFQDINYFTTYLLFDQSCISLHSLILRL